MRSTSCPLAVKAYAHRMKYGQLRAKSVLELASSLVFLILLSACTSSGLGPAGRGETELVIYAASSLTDLFDELAKDFSSKYPGTKVTFNFAGSNQLRAQIEQGAKADIFASANQEEMDKLRDSGLLSGSSAIFAQNELVLVAPRRDEERVRRLEDLATPGLKLVMASPNVPAGNYTLSMLNKLSSNPRYGGDFKDRVLSNVVSQETNVRQVLSKVQLGEADAGIAYASDVTVGQRRDLRVINIPREANVRASYPIAVLKGSRETDLARSFVDYILSAAATGALRKHNFITMDE